VDGWLDGTVEDISFPDAFVVEMGEHVADVFWCMSGCLAITA
jgi:hypothetical protein